MGIYTKKDVFRKLAETKFITDNIVYVMAKLSKADYSKAIDLISGIRDQYIQIICDERETTLICEKNTWDEKFKERFPEAPIFESLGKIFCDAEDPPIGYLYEILQIISLANIGVYVQGAYTTDQIFVDYIDLEKTLGLLENLNDMSSKNLAFYKN